MAFRCSIVHFLGICIVASIIPWGETLDCYSCNVSSTTLDQDGCYGIGSIRKCSASSVCLAATYEIKSGMVISYTTMQSCFPDMAGQECNNFIKTQRDLHRTATVTPSTCYACSDDNCNKSTSKANNGPTFKADFALFVGIILSSSLVKLMQRF